MAAGSSPVKAPVSSRYSVQRVGSPTAREPDRGRIRGQALGSRLVATVWSDTVRGPRLKSMTNDRQPNVGKLIHFAAAQAAAVASGLAQFPGSDAPILVGIQTRLVLDLAHELDAHLTRAGALQLVAMAAAPKAGRGLSQALVGWVPGWGNAWNAATAAAITEAIGWAAVAHLKAA